jgi:hypothetical protein
MFKWRRGKKGKKIKCVAPLEQIQTQTNAWIKTVIFAPQHDANIRSRILKCIAPLEMP